MPRSDHPAYNWPSQRHYLNEALKHLSAFTDNMQTFLELGNEAEQAAEAQVLTLEFGTTTPETLHTSLETLRHDANEKTSMANRAKSLPSRDEVPNVRRQWTFDEQQAIRSALMLGFDSTWLANHLGRTRKGVEHKIDQLRKAGEL